MCGIAAAFGKAADGRIRVKKMLTMLGHRGPDESGVFSLGNSVLGHARLSIIDLETGKQPITSEAGDLAITFNGEVYNFRELRRELAVKHRFSTRTDTEVILHMFEERREDTLPLLDGMFAFLIAGREGFVAARDPLGIKPLYMGRKDGLFLVASEMKAFPEGMENIQSLPAGHYSVNGGRPERFCSPLRSAGIIQKKNRTDIKKDIKALLEKAVVKRLIADVPVGVYLSGGLDSSLVASIMKKHVKELHSFTAGMKDSPDILKARQAARYLDTKHHELIYTKADMKKALEDVIWHLESFDAPLVRSAIPMYFVSALASEHVKVILSGEGADELFAGYSYFSKYRGARLRKEMNRAIMSLQDTNLQRADRISMAHGLEARVPFLDYRLLRYSLGIPVEYLEQRQGTQEKQLLREAFEGYLPEDILYRPKMKFSVGAGSSEELFRECSEKVSDRAFVSGRRLPDGSALRSKEEYYYHEVFRSLFQGRIPPELVGRTADRSAGTERERK
jgi:asparagine synthase (glutamine-hydrolysing)